jgi:hypothetical protein
LKVTNLEASAPSRLLDWYDWYNSDVEDCLDWVEEGDASVEEEGIAWVEEDDDYPWLGMMQLLLCF